MKGLSKAFSKSKYVSKQVRARKDKARQGRARQGRDKCKKAYVVCAERRLLYILFSSSSSHTRKELFIRFTASAFRKLPSIYVFSYFHFGFEGRMWDLIVSVPDHCLSFYFPLLFLTYSLTSI